MCKECKEYKEYKEYKECEDYRRPVYRTYLLTVWQAPGQTPDAARAWRYELIDPYSGERHGFTHLDELPAVLGQFGVSPPPGVD